MNLFNNAKSPEIQAKITEAEGKLIALNAHESTLQDQLTEALSRGGDESPILSSLSSLGARRSAYAVSIERMKADLAKVKARERSVRRNEQLGVLGKRAEAHVKASDKLQAKIESLVTDLAAALSEARELFSTRTELGNGLDLLEFSPRPVPGEMSNEQLARIAGTGGGILGWNHQPGFEVVQRYVAEQFRISKHFVDLEIRTLASDDSEGAAASSDKEEETE